MHRIPTRVTPRADSASLRWHESRHGQPSVIADVSQKYEYHTPRNHLLLHGHADSCAFNSVDFGKGSHESLLWRAISSIVQVR